MYKCNTYKDERNFFGDWLFVGLDIEPDLSMLFTFKTKASFKLFKNEYERLFKNSLNIH